MPGRAITFEPDDPNVGEWAGLDVHERAEDRGNRVIDRHVLVKKPAAEGAYATLSQAETGRPMHR